MLFSVNAQHYENLTRSEGTWFHYDGENSDAMGQGNPHTLGTYMGITEQTLAGFQGQSVQAVKVYISDINVSVIEVKVYSGQGTTLLKSKEFTPVVGWNTILIESVEIPTSGDLFVGVEYTSEGGHIIGIDNGPNEENGFWMYNPIEDDWFDFAYLHDANWNIRVLIDGPTNIDASTQAQIDVYPNPATESFTILNAENSKISVINSLGQIIETVQNSENVLRINSSNYPSGVYFVRIDDGSNSTVKKLIIK